jgi:DNA repair protein RadC
VAKDPARFEAARARALQVGHLDSDAQVARFLRPDLEKEDQEVFVVVGLDIHNDLRCYAEIARGQRHSVRVEPADILRPVLIEGCVGFIVAHNHPSGSATPSPEDRKLTADVSKAASAVRVVFVDHLVLGSGGSYYSFADKKLKKIA